MSFWKVKLGFDILKWLGGKMKTKCRGELIRYHETETETLGLLFVDGNFVCYTLELPWEDNQRDISCIPEDIYTVVPHKTHPEKYRIQNVVGRSGINIEIGNSHVDIEGCIAVGAGAETPIERDMVNYLLGSRVAFNRLKDIIGSEEFQLDIRSI